MKLSIGSDHAGLELKEKIKAHFSHIEFVDAGTHSTESCDYPDYISEVGFQVRDGNADMGIAVCGSGIGASITANKVKSIRAALCTNCYMAEMSRKHNNSNVLVLGSRVTGVDVAMRIVEVWLSTEYEGGRHQRRIDKISDLEK